MAPEVQHIAISMPDGSVAIMQFITRQQRHHDDPGWEREATDQAIEDEISRTAGVTPNSGWRRIDLADIPADRAFRNAWVDSGKTIAVDMPKARDIQRDRLRTERKPLLDALDVDYQRADEADNGAAKAAIIAKKQALRDVTADPAIEAATTPDALMAVTVGRILGLAVEDV